MAATSNLPVEVLTPMAPAERLVDLSSLAPEQRAIAQKLADGIRFDDTTTTLSFVDTALQPLALASRRLLADTTVGEAGEIGRIAAAVIDGIKILRIEELQEEAREVAPKAVGFLSKLGRLGKVAHSAAKTFQENRKQFLGLMDAEEARETPREDRARWLRAAIADIEQRLRTLKPRDAQQFEEIAEMHRQLCEMRAQASAKIVATATPIPVAKRA